MSSEHHQLSDEELQDLAAFDQQSELGHSLAFLSSVQSLAHTILYGDIDISTLSESQWHQLQHLQSMCGGLRKQYEKVAHHHPQVSREEGIHQEYPATNHLSMQIHAIHAEHSIGALFQLQNFEETYEDLIRWVSINEDWDGESTAPDPWEASKIFHELCLLVDLAEHSGVLPEMQDFFTKILSTKIDGIFEQSIMKAPDIESAAREVSALWNRIRALASN